MRPMVPASSPTASARYSGTKMFRTPRPANRRRGRPRRRPSGGRGRRGPCDTGDGRGLGRGPVGLRRADLADGDEDRDRDDDRHRTEREHRPSPADAGRSSEQPRTPRTPSRHCRRRHGRRSPTRSRLAGNCSARSALPTGCWGDPPILEMMLKTANGGNEAANAWAAVATPMTRPPEPSSVRRRNRRRQCGEPVLEEAARDAADGRQDDDRRRRDPELVDDGEVDEGIERGLAMDQRVLHGEQAERDARANLLADGQRDVHTIECSMGAGGSERCGNQSGAVDARPGEPGGVRHRRALIRQGSEPRGWTRAGSAQRTGRVARAEGPCSDAYPARPAAPGGPAGAEAPAKCPDLRLKAPHGLSAVVFRSQISTTTTSRRAARSSRMSMDRDHRPRMECSPRGSPVQPPGGAENDSTRFCRLRCSMSTRKARASCLLEEGRELEIERRCRRPPILQPPFRHRGHVPAR